MRLTKDDMDIQRQNILRESLKIFTEKGYSATTIEDIALATGISRSPFYYNFKNKKILFQHVVAYYLDLMMEDLVQIYAQEKDIFLLIRDNLEGILVRSQRGFNRGYFTKDIKANAADSGQNLIRDFHEQANKIVASVISKSIDQGKIRAGSEPYKMVREIFAFYSGVSFLLDNDIMRDEETGAMIDDFIYALKLRYGAE